MKEFDAITYKEGKGDFNNNDENLLISLLDTTAHKEEVLDVGCGDGQLTRRIKEKFPYSHITAIDNSQEQIAMATREVSDIEFQFADITNYSPEQSFECIYSFYAFPHITKSKLLDALSGARKALRSEGIFYLFTNICLFDTSAASSADQEACDIVFLNNWSSQINLVNMDEMKRMFDETGFEVVQDKKLSTSAKIKDYGDMISWMFILK